METPWFALYTQPRKEYLVRDYLRGEAFQVYLPEVRNKVQRGDRRPCRPFFPQYLFIQDPGKEKLVGVQWTPGLRRIVTFDGQPVIIPFQVIRQIQVRLVCFEEPEVEPFEKGENVHIMSGPFEGMDAVFDQRLSDRDRVRVFLEFVSRIQVPVEMNLQDLLPPANG